MGGGGEALAENMLFRILWTKTESYFKFKQRITEFKQNYILISIKRMHIFKATPWRMGPELAHFMWYLHHAWHSHIFIKFK